MASQHCLHARRWSSSVVLVPSEVRRAWKRLIGFIQSARVFYRRWWSSLSSAFGGVARWSHSAANKKKRALKGCHPFSFGTFLPDDVTCRVCEFLGTAELGRVACTARRVWAVLRDPTWDRALWEGACRRAWTGKRYDPLALYDHLEGRSWREKFVLVTEDAARTVATPRDVQSVKKWRVLDKAKSLEYFVDGWPYRSNFTYVSPTFAPKPSDYVILQAKKHAYIQVSGLPRVKVRRDENTWAWHLVNNDLLLESIDHRPQPTAEMID